MSKFLLIGMVCAGGLSVTAISAAAGLDCSGGELTLSRLADGECVSRIPLPTSRPHAVKAKAVTPVKEWEFVETPGAAPGETRMVRIVGSRFLPDRSERIDFHAVSAANVDPISAVIHRATAYLQADADANPTPTRKPRQALEMMQEASLVLDSATLRK